MDCRTFFNLPGVCEFESHHKYLSREYFVYSKEDSEIKQGETSSEYHEINCLSSFLTQIALFHYSVTCFGNCKIFYWKKKFVMY